MRNTTNDTFFDIIDSEIKAYLLGFFIADGCIYKESQETRKALRLSIGLSEKDEDIIKLYKDNICPNNKLQTTNYKGGAVDRKPVKIIKWSSKYMGDILINKYNIKQRKTNDYLFSFNFNLIQDEFIRHFIRGFFDGDGQVSFSRINKQFTLAMYGTSKIFLTQIGDIISSKLDVNYVIDSTKKKNVELFLLRFNSNGKRKEFIKRLYKWYYEDSEFFMFRKKDIFESYLNTVLM